MLPLGSEYFFTRGTLGLILTSPIVRWIEIIHQSFVSDLLSFVFEFGQSFLLGFGVLSPMPPFNILKKIRQMFTRRLAQTGKTKRTLRLVQLEDRRLLQLLPRVVRLPDHPRRFHQAPPERVGVPAARLVLDEPAPHAVHGAREGDL